MSQETNYIQYFSPDWNRIQTIIRSFKGDRTMAQYAEDCGTIAPSTLSRIITGKATRPLTMKMIIELYNHRDPDSEFEFEDLIKANGMVDAETHKRITTQSASISAKQIHDRGIMMRNILTKELLERGIAIKIQAESMTRRESIEKESSGSIILRPDLTIRLLESETCKTWVFEFVALLTDGDASSNSSRSIARWVFERKSAYLIADAWAPDKYHDTKTSFVFLDPDIYEAFRIYFRHNKLNNIMSTILIDPISGTVEKEELLNLNNTQTSLFEIPLISNEPDYYDDTSDEDLEFLENMNKSFAPDDG